MGRGMTDKKRNKNLVYYAIHLLSLYRDKYHLRFERLFHIIPKHDHSIVMQ